MQAEHVVPQLALARVVTAGGPYRPGDEISLAFTTPGIGRLVAHESGLRASCVPLERALIPEMISVRISHPAEPYSAGEILTLSFVDPRIARVYSSSERSALSFGPGAKNAFADPEGAVAETLSAAAKQRNVVPKSIDAVSERHNVVAEPLNAMPEQHNGITEQDIGVAASSNEMMRDGQPASGKSVTAPLGVACASNSERASGQVRSGERMTMQAGTILHDDADSRSAPRSARDDNKAALTDVRTVAVAYDGGTSSPVTMTHRISVRLEWNSERIRRFVQVVDKLFTIDRLGWYRHSLAMRMLIPDQIVCADTLATVEAMRHLQALRAAAVESLGNPLLAACMPGFSISSQWLQTLESPREARAIAGLRAALIPYANDDESRETFAVDALFTAGSVTRSELLPENATSVEAFLPLLIPAGSHDAALNGCLMEYRRLLVDLFAATARAGEQVRLHQMAQPNHSLDDRLWQVVGAAGEAFGGFAHA